MSRPIKNCLYCGERTNEVKEWCSSKCYHLGHKNRENAMINSQDFKELNGGFAWDEPELVLF